MRTKTLFLTAVAVAAGFSAFAQVYSVNVVGYANVVLEGNGRYTLVANPLDNGSGNQLTNLLSDSLPKQSQVLTWGGATFTTILKGGNPAAWASSVSLPPGTGFFVRNGIPGQNGPQITNTFVGSVVAGPGGSVTNLVPLGYSLNGSPIPYAGNLAIAGQSGGDASLNLGDILTKQSQLLTWDKVSQTYVTTLKGGNPATWGATVPIAVGEGFFINNKNGPATNWVQTLP